uniref:Uncharacterized protein n=1 Tax=Rhizophora mucronata TaxID=61149 RepID=A0A2P2Q8Q5_RHIMU
MCNGCSSIRETSKNIKNDHV